MYNDWGSVDRDRAEGDLGSVDLAEFQETCMENSKAALFWLAEHEREGLERAFARLRGSGLDVGNSAERSSAAHSLALLRLFMDVTDLYGQIYVVKDIASLMN